MTNHLDAKTPMPLGLSGARSLLSPYRERRALSLTGDVGLEGLSPSTIPAVGGLDRDQVVALINSLVPGLIGHPCGYGIHSPCTIVGWWWWWWW